MTINNHDPQSYPQNSLADELAIVRQAIIELKSRREPVYIGDTLNVDPNLFTLSRQEYKRELSALMVEEQVLIHEIGQQEQKQNLI